MGWVITVIVVVVLLGYGLNSKVVQSGDIDQTVPEPPDDWDA